MKTERSLLSRFGMVEVAWGAALALLAIGALLGARTELGYRADSARAVAVQADILARSVSAALAFDDTAVMRQYVDALRANPAISAAAVYDTTGARVAEFHRQGRTPPARMSLGTTPPAGGGMQVTRAVSEQGARLGLVYLETRPEPLTAILARHAALALLTLMAFLMLGVVTAAAAQLQARARLLSEANARLLEEMAARGKAEEALRQSQKMEALGQLTGGIAHDFNNLLQVIHGAFELISRKADDTARVAAWAKNGLVAAERGASLTRQLLAFSRSHKLELRAFAAGPLIREMQDLLVRTLGPDIALTLELDPAPLSVLSDRTQLELAVLNLAINARDAMPNGGRLRISTRPLTVAAGDPTLEAGDYVELTVADSGEGMAPEVVERAFDPFFTTKGVGKGTGLGLSQVYGVARQAGGLARIASRPGEGAAISLLLRSAEPGAVAAAEPSPATPRVLAAQPGRTVLVVDDEEQVRALTAETLEMLGYRVLTAGGGESALEVLRSEAPDVMLFDYAMPGMSGAELAQRARRLRPGAPIVFASGHADTDAVEAAVGPDATILRKPFDMESLAVTIARLLG